jgi:hypothetical protein
MARKLHLSGNRSSTDPGWGLLYIEIENVAGLKTLI